MPAPLYSRYRRYADREANRFAKAAKFRGLVRLWKRPETRVYSLSNRAAYEAGAWSTLPVGDLLRGMSAQYLPAPFVWVEVPWPMLQAGSAGIPVEGMETRLRKDTPVRVAAMLFQSSEPSPDRPKEVKWLDASMPPKTILSLVCYLYPNGSVFVGPLLCMWSPDQALWPLMNEIAEESDEERDSMVSTGIGDHYLSKRAQANPRLTKKLRERMACTIAGTTFRQTPEARQEFGGISRLLMACLMAALSAKPPKYPPAKEGASPGRSGPSGPKRTVTEVDLFLRERQRQGESLRASVGVVEGIKKGLHKVGAHYAYRKRSDGRDPTVCYMTQFGMHDWEPIEGTKSEVCAVCGQKRWFKAAHERGDEKYGVVPPKTYNVRV